MASAKPLTKSQTIAILAEKNELSKKQVSDLLDSLQETAVAQTKKVGKFALPGLAFWLR